MCVSCYQQYIFVFVMSDKVKWNFHSLVSVNCFMERRYPEFSSKAPASDAFMHFLKGCFIKKGLKTTYSVQIIHSTCYWPWMMTIDAMMLDHMVLWSNIYHMSNWFTTLIDENLLFHCRQFSSLISFLIIHNVNQKNASKVMYHRFDLIDR